MNKIEMNKKYETKAGEKVLIYSVTGGCVYSVHGAVDTVMGYRMCTWTHEGCRYEGEDGDSDLIELKEDWEILVEHFENNKDSVMVKVGSDIFTVSEVLRGVNYDYKHMEIIISSEGHTVRCLKANVKLATLEDCDEYILGK